MSDDLTPRQQQVLDFIAGYIREQGYPPTLRGIGKAMGIRSPNGVVCNLRALERKGYIRHSPKASRGITLLGERTREQELLDAVDRVLRDCKPDSPMASWALKHLAEKREPFGGVGT